MKLVFFIYEVIFYKIAIIFIKSFIMNNIQITLSFLPLSQIIQTPITASNSFSILYFILRINYFFSEVKR